MKGTEVVRTFKLLADILGSSCPDPENIDYINLICGKSANLYYSAGIFVLIGYMFCIVLEVCSFFRIINKLVNGPKCKCL